MTVQNCHKAGRFSKRIKVVKAETMFEKPWLQDDAWA